MKLDTLIIKLLSNQQRNRKERRAYQATLRQFSRLTGIPLDEPLGIASKDEDS